MNIIDLTSYRYLRQSSPEGFARRIRIRARQLGCTVTQAQHIGAVAQGQDDAGRLTRFAILARAESAARQLAGARHV